VDIKKQGGNFFLKSKYVFVLCLLKKWDVWWIHNNKDSKMAILGVKSAGYKKFSKGKTLKIVKTIKLGT
jgi:hypothetical protein